MIRRLLQTQKTLHTPTSTFRRAITAHSLTCNTNTAVLATSLATRGPLMTNSLARTFSAPKISELLESLPPTNIRNVAIIAHVDHGKTTLVDCLLKDSGAEIEHNSRTMDNIELEQEKGITIMSKVTGIQKDGYLINLVDTPGHQDFGGEVERIMCIVDAVLLVVCATEGPKAQTKFVLKKAIEAGKKPIVVINKVDRESASPEDIEGLVFDLFVDIDEEGQFAEEYDVFYASAKGGYAVPSDQPLPGPNDPKSTECILDAIIKSLPAPQEDSGNIGVLPVSQIEYHPYFGKMARGKLLSQEFKVGDEVSIYDSLGEFKENSSITKIYMNVDLADHELPSAQPGLIYSMGGVASASIGDMICKKDEKRVVDMPVLDPPMIAVRVKPNSSPRAGMEASKTNSMIILSERLEQESELDAALSVTSGSSDILIEGRGDLHIGVLFEKLRREGFELETTCPTVITKIGSDGETLEPVEEITIIYDEKYSQSIMEKLMSRNGAVVSMDTLDDNNNIQLVVEFYSRFLFGFRMEIMTLTSNTAIYETKIARWEEEPDFEESNRSCLISTCSGIAKTYALKDFEKLGSLFVGNGDPVYEGMIIGESHNEFEWNVNATKEKKVTNVRASGKDEAVRLIPPRQFKLEDAISYIRDDELVEITPKGCRIRKKELNQNLRKQQSRKN